MDIEAGISDDEDGEDESDGEHDHDAYEADFVQATQAIMPCVRWAAVLEIHSSRDRAEAWGHASN